MGSEAIHLQQMMISNNHRASVVAITSGKGGVGKTNIAANLALCISATRKKVLLVDADLSLGNLDIIMNIHNRYNIWHVINGRKRIDEIIYTPAEGLEVICGASGLEDLANLNEFQRQRLLNELSKLQNNSDVILIDTAAGISKSVIGFCLAADEVLVTTTPEATSMTDAYAVIKILVGHSYNGRISIVVNMADTTPEGKRVYQQIANVVRRFLNRHVHHAGTLPKDDRLVSAVKCRKPVVLAYPKARITSSMAALASRLTGAASTNSVDEEGFFRRVVDWFF